MMRLYAQAPVSYTHLDVYKRQAGDLAVFAQVFLPERGQSLAGIRSGQRFAGLRGQLFDDLMQ